MSKFKSNFFRFILFFFIIIILYFYLFIFFTIFIVLNVMNEMPNFYLIIVNDFLSSFPYIFVRRNSSVTRVLLIPFIL